MTDYEHLGKAINDAALLLPHGYQLCIEIENRFCNMILSLPDGTAGALSINTENFAERLEQMIVFAQQHNAEHK